MANTTSITCPKCGNNFKAEDAIAADIEKEIKAKYINRFNQDQATLAAKEADLRKDKEQLEKLKKDQEELLNNRVQQEKLKLGDELKKKLQEDFQLQIKSLQEENEEKTGKLREIQGKELELMRKQKALEEQQSAFELELERKMLDKQREIEEKVKLHEQEKTDLRMREKDKQVDDLRKMVDELKRKSEQGSMQLQGEVQELALEELLRANFPFDLISEVGKGVKGADVIQTVRNERGVECGKILYESKRTKDFNKEWIEKLKNDLRGQKAHIAVIVTETMPKDMDRFGQKDGVWICSFPEAKGLAQVLRDSLLKLHGVLASQENKGDKMNLLYDFLTSDEFRQQMEAIVEGFMSMKLSISRERVQMEKMWKEREKQLDKVLINASGFYGSVKGIAGNAVADIKLLEGDSDLVLEG